MQIVGRECELCRVRLKSEADTLGCERCEIAFHTACLKTGGPPGGPTTYRDATVKKSKRSWSLCPTCGDDLRALQEERDAERDSLHAEGEAHRAREEERRARTTRMARGAGMIVLAFVLFALRVWLRVH